MPNDKWDVQEQVPQIKLPKRKGNVSMGPREKPLIKPIDDTEKFDKNGMYIPQKVREKERKHTLQVTMSFQRRKLFGRK